MKIPQSPPVWLKLDQDIAEQSKAKLFAQQLKWSTEDRYLHWNDLRRRPSPSPFNHEEWWYILKLNRKARYQAIGLTDTQSRRFVFGQTNALTELLHQIDRGLGLALGLPEAITQPGLRDRYVVNTLIDEAITSSQLEGAATTRAEARQLLRSKRPPRDKSERMILNNFLTMQRIRDLRHEKLTPELIFELHRQITDGTLEKEDAAGRFRLAEENVRVTDEDGVELHLPPPADELPMRMAALCAFANGEDPAYFIHPVIRGIILHFWLAYDHPFYDGNGRTARALFYWSMLRQEYPLFEFISISEILLRAPKKYAMAFLHTESDDNDLTYFILHQAGVIQEAVQALRDYLERKKQELKTASAQLHGMQELNHRQQALLIHALREPATSYQIIMHQHSHAVTHQTARSDLFDLVNRGLLVVRKAGRAYRFHAPGDLAEKLGHLAATVPTATADQATLPLKLPLHPGEGRDFPDTIHP